MKTIFMLFVSSGVKANSLKSLDSLVGVLLTKTADTNRFIRGDATKVLEVNKAKRFAIQPASGLVKVFKGKISQFQERNCRAIWVHPSKIILSFRFAKTKIY